MSPEIASMRGRLGAYESWARTEDRAARTAAARKAALSRFEDLVDPDKQLTPAERARRAEYKRRAHMTRLALKSAQVRQARAAGKPQPDPQARIAELERLATGGDAAMKRGGAPPTTTTPPDPVVVLHRRDLPSSVRVPPSWTAVMQLETNEPPRRRFRGGPRARVERNYRTY
jgi:hypothetical protein